jgi:uncharacterized protein
MIKRDDFDKAQYLLTHFPSIALLGSRQVGKTTLAKAIADSFQTQSIYFDLENDRDVFQFDTDAQSLLEKHLDKLVIIDEVQRMPRLFALLRAMIDTKRTSGRYLLLGSASPDLIQGVSESLAGRISYLTLYPLSILEAQSANIDFTTHWFRGGYPNALLAANDDLAMQWLDDYIKSYIERDLSVIYNINIDRIAIRNFWRMLASSNGGILNVENFARALSIKGNNVQRYLDLLEGAYLIYRLPAWYFNVKKRVVKSPKAYITDSGILHRLNQIPSLDALEGHVLVGASWEGYVVQHIIQYKSRGIEAFYYRTQNGAEADLVLVKADKPVATIEIKNSATPILSAGFYNCISDLETTQNYVICKTKETITDNIRNIIYCDLNSFLTDFLPKI